MVTNGIPFIRIPVSTGRNTIRETLRLDERHPRRLIHSAEHELHRRALPRQHHSQLHNPILPHGQRHTGRGKRRNIPTNLRAVRRSVHERSSIRNLVRLDRRKHNRNRKQPAAIRTQHIGLKRRPVRIQQLCTIINGCHGFRKDHIPQLHHAVPRQLHTDGSRQRQHGNSHDGERHNIQQWRS